MKKINWQSASFVGSYPQYNLCPQHQTKEVAFIGRSNVGKSSLINALLERKNLAKTSSQPGKTQAVNLFTINDQWHLCDLPGYGWAKVSKTTRTKFGDLIQDYILNREQLSCLFVLIDVNIPPQKIDLEFIEWLGIEGIPFALVFTKGDRQSQNKNASNIAQFKKQLLQTFETVPPVFATSSSKKLGLEEVRGFISKIINEEVI